MADLFYDALCLLGRPVFWVCSRPVVIGAHHTEVAGGVGGGCFLAANHTSPYDIPLMMRHCRRRVDFLSITEVFRNPLVAAFYGSMNAFPLDRAAPDAPAVRTLLRRIQAGRMVGIFPEGEFRQGAAAMTAGGPIRPGIARLVRLAGVPIVPCAIVHSAEFSRFTAWLPFRHTRYGIGFGTPLPPETDDLQKRLVSEITRLHAELSQRLAAMPKIDPKNPAPNRRP